MNALRTWRKNRGITIETMADRLGVSVGSLSRIERGEQWPDRGFFERMATETEGYVTANDFVRDVAAQTEPYQTVNGRAA